MHLKNYCGCSVEKRISRRTRRNLGGPFRRFLHNTLYIVSPPKIRPIIIIINNFKPELHTLALCIQLRTFARTFAFALSSLLITSSLDFIHHKLYCPITSHFIALFQIFCFIVTTLLFPEHNLYNSAPNDSSHPSECPSPPSAKSHLPLFSNSAQV